MGRVNVNDKNINGPKLVAMNTNRQIPLCAVNDAPTVFAGRETTRRDYSVKQ